MKTKQLLFTLSLLFICLALKAQLNVFPNGKVGVGTTTPEYGFLEIGKSGLNGGLSIYDNSLNIRPLKLYTQGSFGFLNFSGNIEYGIRIKNNGHLFLGANAASAQEGILNLYLPPQSASSAIMINANYSNSSVDMVKLFSTRSTDMTYVVRSAGQSGAPYVFYVRGDGSVYSKGSVITPSDRSFKTNITKIEHGLDKIKRMEGVTYSLKDQPNESINAFSNRASDSIPVNDFESNIEVTNKIKEELGRKKVGFIAQDLEKIFPEVVYTLPDGKKAIAYSEIIPLLVEAIKEQQNEIDELKRVNPVQTRAVSSDTIEEDTSDKFSSIKYKSVAVLHANTPNPFKEQTKISFFIPDDAIQASLHLYNLQGKQLKQVSINERGNSYLTINGYELTPGMYIYSLIINGQEIDSKKMILTE